MIRLKNAIALSLLALMAGCSSPSKTGDRGTKAPMPAPEASPVATPQPSPAAGTESRGLEVICQQGTDKRSITVVPAQSGCEVHYVKFGKSEVIATGSSGSQYCDQAQSKVRSNLESSGFTCR